MIIKLIAAVIAIGIIIKIIGGLFK